MHLLVLHLSFFLVCLRYFVIYVLLLYPLAPCFGLQYPSLPLHRSLSRTSFYLILPYPVHLSTSLTKAPSSFGPPHRALHYLYLPLLGKPPDSMHPDSQLDHNQLTPPFGWYLVTCVDRVHLYVTRRLHGALSLAIQQIRPCFTSQWIEQAT